MYYTTCLTIQPTKVVNISKNAVFTTLLLTVMWLILNESITVQTVIIGLLVSGACVFLCRRLIPMERVGSVSLFRLFIYFLYLIWQIYLAGFAAIRIVLTGAHVEVVVIKTGICNRYLKTLLANSITLIPGSVTLDVKDDCLTVLWLTRQSAGRPDIENADEILKGKLERILLKVQK